MTTVTKIMFVPHFVSGGLFQQMSHGRQRGVRFCHVNNRNRMRIILPEGKTVTVRYIKGGLMYHGLVLGRIAYTQPKQALRRIPNAQPVRFASPASCSARPPAKVPQRQAAVLSMRQMLGNLTAIEAQNRINALKAARTAG